MTALDTLRSTLAVTNGTASVTVDIPPDQHIAVTASELFMALGGVVPPKLLPVPYYSQEDSQSRAYANDCGPACVHMLLDWQSAKVNLSQLNVTTNQLSGETTLNGNDTGLGNAALVTLAGRHSLLLRSVSGVDQAFIQGQIDAGLPVICLISYAPIQERENQRDLGGHFVVAVGYDAQNIYVNDPDWWASGRYTPEMGHNFRIPWNQFNAALATYNNTGCIAVRLFQPTKLYVVLTDMNVRSGPSVYNAIAGEAKLGSIVTVDLNQQIPDTKGNLFVPLWGGNWIALKNTPQNRVYLDVAMPEPPTTTTKLGVGIHYMATGPDREIIALAKTLADQGKAFFIKLCKSRAFSDALQVEQIKKANEKCIVVLRPEPDWENAYPQYKQWNLPNLRLSGREFAQIYIDNFITNVLDNRLADYHEINCEPAYGPGTPSFWQGVMDTFEANNLHCTVGNWSVFHPPLPGEHDASGLRSWDTFWQWPETIDMVRRVKAGGHCLGFDEYIYPDPNGSWLAPECMFRHDSVVKLLPADLQDVTIYILEFGTVENAILSDDQLLAAWQAWDGANIHALGAAAWSFGLQGNITSPALLSGRVALMQRYLLAR